MLALVPSQKPQRHVLALWAHRTTLNDLMQNGQSLWDAHFQLSIGLLPACSVLERVSIGTVMSRLAGRAAALSRS